MATVRKRQKKDKDKVKFLWVGKADLKEPHAAALEGTAGIAFNRQFNLFYHCI